MYAIFDFIEDHGPIITFKGNVLIFIILTFFIYILLILFTQNTPKQIKIYSTYFTIFQFFIAIYLWILLFKSYSQYGKYVNDVNNATFTHFMFKSDITLIANFKTYLPIIDLDLAVGVDGLSGLFLVLINYIMVLCILASSFYMKNYKQFIIYLLLTQLFLILSFIVIDLFLFYIAFESVLIPMFIIIGTWGSRARKIKAAYYFFLYTLFGSLILLFGILWIYTIIGSTKYDILFINYLPENLQCRLWIFFFIPFAIKVPMVPFHIWLPEAHVEAPTIGSVILASLILKLGGYGFLRFNLTLFPLGHAYFMPLIYLWGVTSVIYASLATIRQIDLKRIIAYSSIAHMNMTVLGIFAYQYQSIDGSIYLMLAHGIVSGALFFCVGMLYDRYHTRLIRYFGGLVQTMPLFALFFFFFSLANMGFPGTSNFVGEFLILVGLFAENIIVSILAATSIIWAAIYSIWLYNRLIFGTIKTIYIHKFIDLTQTELFILFCLGFSMIVSGLNTEFITELSKPLIADKIYRTW